mgnify:CR=1 FL=1
MKTKLEEVFKQENQKTYIIAEIGNNFNGNFNLAKKSIDKAKEAGADAVKFQTFKADEFVADKNLKFTYQTLEGEEITENQYDMFKRLELPNEWHKTLFEYASSNGIDFFTSAADKNAVDLLIKLKVPAIKVASEDLINVNLLEHMASHKYPVILSTGMGNSYEIKNAVEIFKKYNSHNLIIMHCVSQYPTPLNHASLKRIKALSKAFNFPIGYSDHTEGWEAPMLSVAYGARIIEKHFTLDKSLPGPDHKMATNPEEFKELINMVKIAEETAGEETLNYHKAEEQFRINFRRSIVASKYLPKGTILQEDMLSYMRPGDGLKPYQKDLVIGKKLKKAIKKSEKILQETVK